MDVIEPDGASGVRIAVKAVPGASRDQIAGVLGDRLKVRVAAPPEGGKANRAICRVLAEALGVKAAGVAVVAGASSPEKVVRVEGVDAARARACLLGESRGEGGGRGRSSGGSGR